MPAPKPPFYFDRNVARYRDSQGRFQSVQQVWETADTVMDNLAKDMVSQAQALQTGDISLRDWQLQMERQIKDAHLSMYAAAKGGWEQMTPADFGRAGNLIKKQYQYLRDWVQEIEEGLPFDGRQIQRAGLYARAPRETLSVVQRLEEQVRGKSQKRNILGIADHCHGSPRGCVEITGLGWVPIEAGPDDGYYPIGSRLCLVRCKCFEEFR